MYKSAPDQDKGIQTRFFEACERGSKQEVMSLLADYPGIDVNWKTATGWFPLMIACEKGHVEVVDILLKHSGINLKQTRKEYSPFYMACVSNHLEVVKRLLAEKSRIDVNRSPSTKCTPFYIACEQNLDAIVKELLSSEDVDVDRCTTKAYSPVLIALYKGNDKVVNILANHQRIDINKKLSDGNTALHRLCEIKRGTAVRRLLENFPDVNLTKKNSLGQTALEIAQENGYREIANMLLAKIEWLSSSGSTSNEIQISGQSSNSSSISNELPPSDEINTQGNPFNDYDPFDEFRFDIHGSIDNITLPTTLAKTQISGRSSSSSSIPNELPLSDEINIQGDWIIDYDYKPFDELPNFSFDIPEPVDSITPPTTFAKKTLASDLFALLTMLYNGCFSASKIPLQQNERRFFLIAEKLPIELRMQLCHRVFDSALDIITQSDQQTSVQRLAQNEFLLLLRTAYNTNEYNVQTAESLPDDAELKRYGKVCRK
jgi:ankyrin repeat protein